MDDEVTQEELENMEREARLQIETLDGNAGSLRPSYLATCVLRQAAYIRAMWRGDAG